MVNRRAMMKSKHSLESDIEEENACLSDKTCFRSVKKQDGCQFTRMKKQKKENLPLFYLISTFFRSLLYLFFNQSYFKCVQNYYINTLLVTLPNDPNLHFKHTDKVERTMRLEEWQWI